VGRAQDKRGGDVGDGASLASLLTIITTTGFIVRRL
jgi:hypothetical protein